MTKVTYMTKDDIVRLNNKAVRLKKNRSIYEKGYKMLKDGVKYPIGMHFVHNDTEIRAQVSYGDASFWLDMDVEDFNKLPTTEVQVDA